MKFPIFVSSEFEESERELKVLDPYSDSIFATTFYPSLKQIKKAIKGAFKSFDTVKKLPIYNRVEILRNIANGIKNKREHLANIITRESGKPISNSMIEVERALFTLETSIEEAKRIGGDTFPLDFIKSTEGRWGYTKRFPIGPVLGVTPFNFPLNLAMHKIAPAIASGNTIVLQVSPKTPIVMLEVAKTIQNSGLPKGAVSIFPVSSDLYEELLASDLFKLITFTGSAQVGWNIRARAGKKKVVLELGGNAGLIIDKGVSPENIISRVIAGSFGYAGQVCISIQRIYIHKSLYVRFCRLLVNAAKNIIMGDPKKHTTDLGPMINKDAVKKTKTWVNEAISSGAKLLTGGKSRRNNIFEPTILEKVPEKCKVNCEEVFAPVVVVYPFTNFEEAVKKVNNSRFGLQAGVYTNFINNAIYAFEELEVGGVIINDIPTFRIDPMPYGGIKDSGVGREGVKYAIEEMTIEKLLVVKS